ncbi:DUF4013 domain-containing protein [Rhodanobacter sp. C01]|uniref:DUF4013 domain-containing protein n=1 Tax=Rhodanobacter sp. C01 TaxID=1945856 RepID=UPI000987ABB6|nr:DUF4013 domain-containing protein [Rhodanobacter sp. C01]OOG47105.1 hypothetical protein B0E50_14350 [Rhodanobacter sp. C01]
MPRIELIDSQQPLSQQLPDALRYPLHGAALPAIVTFTLAHYLALLPGAGWLLELVVWAATYLYALECMRHTADGYAAPPEFAEPGHGGWALVAVLLWSTLLTLAVKLNFGGNAWIVTALMAVSLPAIAMSLALDGSVGHALNPLTWVQVMSRFGLPYLLLIGVQCLIAVIVGVAQLAFESAFPRVISLPLFYLVANYATLFNFHLMGVLIHQRHEDFGLQPKAHQLAREIHQDADRQLLDEVSALASEQPRAALDLLVPRLRDHAAPASLHHAYRQLLQRQGLNDALLVHGQIWMAALIAQGESRRALGVLQECSRIDADFIPDDPRTCGELADLAARLGMNRLALQLCRGYLAHWPRDQQALHYGLLAARLLGEHHDQHVEAKQLLDQLASTWPGHPLQADIAVQRQRLADSP